MDPLENGEREPGVREGREPAQHVHMDLSAKKTSPKKMWFLHWQHMPLTA